MLRRSAAPRVLVLAIPRPTVAHHRTNDGQLCQLQRSPRQEEGTIGFSWRKEKRTQMGSASSIQRRRCLLREECEDALLLKEQCAFDKKSNERFSGAPCCLGCHNAQLGTKWDSRQRLWLPVVGRARGLAGAQPSVEWAPLGVFARPGPMMAPEPIQLKVRGCGWKASRKVDVTFFQIVDRFQLRNLCRIMLRTAVAPGSPQTMELLAKPLGRADPLYYHQRPAPCLCSHVWCCSVALHQLSTRKRTLMGATDVLVRR